MEKISNNSMACFNSARQRLLQATHRIKVVFLRPEVSSVQEFFSAQSFPLSWDFAGTFIQSKLFAQIRLTAFSM
jgi:hypothetical protein